MKKNNIKQRQKYRLYTCYVICFFCGYFGKASYGLILMFLNIIVCLAEGGFKD